MHQVVDKWSRVTKSYRLAQNGNQWVYDNKRRRFFWQQTEQEKGYT